jgi:hypothetical protein
MKIIRSRKSLADLHNSRLFFTPPTMQEIMDNPEWRPITLPAKLDEQMDLFNVLDKKRLTSDS